MADWIEYDTQFVRRRYNKLAPIYVKIYRPLLTMFLKLTVLGNPDVDILEDLRQLAGEIEVQNLFMDTYFIGRATKPHPDE